MLILEQLGQNIFTSGEFHVSIRYCTENELDVLTHRRITDLISELNMLGVINTRVVSRGRYGRKKRCGLTQTRARSVKLAQGFATERVKDLDVKQMEAKWLKTWFR